MTDNTNQIAQLSKALAFAIKATYTDPNTKLVKLFIELEEMTMCYDHSHGGSTATEAHDHIALLTNLLDHLNDRIAEL